ncbi:hypothetical protein ABH926_009679 [Catenulispora sp. GP43]|uniref:SitI3 family protein n=1 Tax=Catenulispora sp. GP43 TaxID=3156263 RepID=UPI0035147532
MAIEFTVQITAGRPASALVESVAAVARDLALLGPDADPAQLLDGLDLANGTWLRVRDDHPQPWQTVPAALGFTSDVSLYFRLDKWQDLTAQQDDLIRLSLGLLDHVPGDMVLHREYETAWFVRKAGVLTLTDLADRWTPERLAWVTHPYQRAFIDLDA